jgi:hypothetical protein
MDALPDELIVVIAADRLAVIDGLRATCGRFRRLLAVPPLVLNELLMRDDAGYRKNKSIVVSRGDHVSSGLVWSWSMRIYDPKVTWALFNDTTVNYILRGECDYTIAVEMTRGRIIDGSFTSSAFSIAPYGTLLVNGIIAAPTMAADPADRVIFRAHSGNKFPVHAYTILGLSRVDTRDTFMAALVHVKRVPDFAAVGWKLSGVIPHWARDFCVCARVYVPAVKKLNAPSRYIMFPPKLCGNSVFRGAPRSRSDAHAPQMRI